MCKILSNFQSVSDDSITGFAPDALKPGVSSVSDSQSLMPNMAVTPLAGMTPLQVR